MKTDEKNEKNENKLKEEYEKLRKKYNRLPEFKKFDEEFDISKTECGENTFSRDIRKVMVIKFFAVLNFVEMLLNPSNGTMFQMFLVKGINSNEKDTLNSLFDKLGVIEIESFALDINYNEEKEVEFIINNFKQWNDMKSELNMVIESLKNNWRKTNTSKGKSYFG